MIIESGKQQYAREEDRKKLGYMLLPDLEIFKVAKPEEDFVLITRNKEVRNAYEKMVNKKIGAQTIGQYD